MRCKFRNRYLLALLAESLCQAGDSYTGCGVSSTQPNSEGNAFNAVGGGVYAMEWTSTAIQIWFFPRDRIPPSISNVSALSPDVSSFVSLHPAIRNMVSHNLSGYSRCQLRR